MTTFASHALLFAPADARRRRRCRASGGHPLCCLVPPRGDACCREKVLAKKSFHHLKTIKKVGPGFRYTHKSGSVRTTHMMSPPGSFPATRNLHTRLDRPPPLPPSILHPVYRR